MKCKALFVLLAFLPTIALSASVHAQQSSSMIVTVNGDNFGPGDLVMVTIQVSHPTECRSSPPCLVVEFLDLAISLSSQAMYVQPYLVTITNPANLTIPTTGGTLAFTILPNAPTGEYEAVVLSLPLPSVGYACPSSCMGYSARFAIINGPP